MNSKEEKKNVLKPQVVYVKEDFYNEIINGFNQQKQKEQADYQRMPILLNSTQRRRFRAVVPIVFDRLFKGPILQDVVHGNYKIAKDKKIKLIRDSFITSWYDLDYWFKKLHKEDEQLDAEDKGGFIGKFIKGVKIFARFSRIFQALKQIRHNDGSRRLFGQSYDLTNALDYNRFQTNLNWTLQGVQQMFCPVVVKWLQPTIYQVRVAYDVGMQKMWDRFCWWLLKKVTIGTSWSDIILNAISWGITAASLIASGISGGTSMLLSMGVWGARIMKILNSITKPMRAMLKARGMYKAIRTVSVVGRRVMHKMGITRGLNSARTMLQNQKVLWASRASRLKRFNGKFKAVRNKWYVKRVAQPIIDWGVFAAMWYGWDEELINHMETTIHKRCRLMWRQVQAKYLIQAKMMADTVVDLSGIISNSAEKIKEGLMQKPKRLSLDNISKRTEQIHGMKAVPVDEKQYNDNPLIDGLLRLRLCFESLFDFMQQTFGDSKRQLFYWNIAYHYKGADRWTFSMGSGKVGFALYNDGKRFAAEYLSTADEYKRLDGYTRRLKNRNIQHLYFYNLGIDKFIDSYYTLGLYKSLRIAFDTPQPLSEQQMKNKPQYNPDNPDDLSYLQGKTIIKDMTMGQMKNAIISNYIVKLGKVVDGKLAPLAGTAFEGSTAFLQGVKTYWRFYSDSQGSYFDIGMQETPDIVSKKDRILGKSGYYSQRIEAEVHIAKYMKLASIHMMEKVFPPPAQVVEDRKQLLAQFSATATQLGMDSNLTEVSANMVTWTRAEMKQRTEKLKQIQQKKIELQARKEAFETQWTIAQVAHAVGTAAAIAAGVALTAAITASTLGFGTAAAVAAGMALTAAMMIPVTTQFMNAKDKYNTQLSKYINQNDTNNSLYKTWQQKCKTQGSLTFDMIQAGNYG